jgi:conserved repeat domain
MKTKCCAFLRILAAMGALISLGVGTAWAGGPWFVSPSGNDGSSCLSSGAACLTINGAIGKASAGDTINVAPGTYNENLTIAIALTLVGPNAGIDPNTGSRVSEAVINGGTGFTIKPEATNIIINGFTVLADNSGEAIYNAVADAADIGGLTISYNIVTGGIRAITLESNGGNISILHNRLSGHVRDIQAGDGTWGNLKINDNYFLTPVTNSTTIQMGPAGTGPVNGFEFKNNHVYGSNNIGSNITNGTVSGNIFDEGASDDRELQIALHNPSTVTGNTFLGHTTSTCFQLYGSQFGLVPSENVTVSGNAFTDCGAAASAPFAYAIQLSQDIHHITITGNTITNAYDGINTRIGTGWDFTGKNIHVNNNSITGSRNIAVNNTVTGTLDATCNWWGAANGPGPVGPGSGDPVSTNVNFTPFLSSSNLAGGCTADPGTSTVSASPPSVVADGTTTSTITVTLRDSVSNPVSGKTVTLVAGSGSSVISAASGPSDASGVVTFTVKDAVAETVTYTAHDTTDSVTLTSTAAVTFTAIPVADISITKTVAGAPPYAAGANRTYTITVANNGGSAATGVTVSDTLPAGTTFVSATPSQGSCSGTATVSCALGGLVSGGSATISLVLTTSSTPGVVSNTATVTAAQLDTNLNNNTSTSTITTIPASQIPAISGWALIALAAMLVLLGAMKIRS